MFIFPADLVPFLNLQKLGSGATSGPFLLSGSVSRSHVGRYCLCRVTGDLTHPWAFVEIRKQRGLAALVIRQLERAVSSTPGEFRTSACTLLVGNIPGFAVAVGCATHTSFEGKAGCGEEALISGRIYRAGTCQRGATCRCLVSWRRRADVTPGKP